MIGMKFEMARAARIAVEECMKVKGDEEVCIVTDVNMLSIAEALAYATKSIGAETTMVIMSTREMHGNEPPRVVSQAMLGADVVLAPTTYSITHTSARVKASEAGARVLILRGVTEEMMSRGAMLADYKKVREDTEKVADILTKGRMVRVTSKFGTDVEFSIEGREAFVLAGFYNPKVGFAVLPDGEAPIAPVEGTANGTIVFDTSMDGIGLLSEPIRLTVSNGKVTKIEGGKEAGRLREIIEGADENATNIAEFAIGTNPKARIIGILAEDKKRMGSVHFALGSSFTLGGKVKSKIHVDGLIKEPTVIVDGKEIVKEGRLIL
ncbi:MAG: aminopeptidase [Nitrososphaerota archaeon]|nr:aminopeptidase [Nitrososphaerales archaeon]MDW8044257.1 aminopeptidase [Nitrososphaerota archaeon]